MEPTNLTELRDWFAAREKWVKTLAEGADERDGEDGYFWTKGVKWQWDHPFLPTLDAAAGAMPEGWEWSRMYGLRMWVAAKPDSQGLISGGWEVQTPDTGKEEFDRYLLAYRVCVAMD